MNDMMNRFELRAISNLMYGNNNWRADVQHLLGFSSKSNTLNRLLDGEYTIKDGIAEEMFNHLQAHSQLIQSAIAFLEFRKTKEKIILSAEHGDEVIIIDKKGIAFYSSLLAYKHYSTTQDYIYYNARIPNIYTPIIPFLSKVIEIIFLEINQGKASISDIEKYFILAE